MTEPNLTPTTSTPATPRWTRLAAIALLVATLGVILGGVSLAVSGAQVRRDSARSTLVADQTKWDQAADQHDQCVMMARSRSVTIAQNEAQYETQVRQLDAQVRFVDLIDGIIALVPSSKVTDEAFVKTANERARIARDRAQVDTDHATAVAQRPPLDESKCSPAPAGPRPT